ncbi:hypothetical protein QBC34DRAFT_490117 [Podospora aff. communis PSN243]|uniref:Uncharacterized protein n=1 Tax=Podospora aff. communis PSN243 TaxID=3040156 RepID=A0AAV9H3K8_9PEZI|nr:hypothetical protein QBC34DRAFT_490117 [Podospora aff. communis PSN243]
MTAQVCPSRGGDASPRYSALQDDPFSSVHRLSTSSGSRPDIDAQSVMTAPPPYDISSKPFLPTVSFQIETPGKPLLALPLPLRPDPIPIFTVPTTDTPSTSTLTPTYLSLRPTRSSGSSYLISPSPSYTPGSESSPLSTTTYRFGPSRAPIINIYTPHSHPPTTNPFLPSPSSPSSESGTDLSLHPHDSFPLTTPSLLSRTTEFRTRHGTFQWCYASRRERQTLTPVPNSLLLLEKVTRVARAHNPKKPDEIRTLIARFIRDETTRSEGSSASSAGNGGRLEVDLAEWDEGEKSEREMVVVMVVTTVLAMLKREVDRRRAAQFVVLTGAVGN